MALGNIVKHRKMLGKQMMLSVNGPLTEGIGSSPASDVLQSLQSSIRHIQSTLDISNSDLSNSTKLDASI